MPIVTGYIVFFNTITCALANTGKRITQKNTWRKSVNKARGKLFTQMT